MSDFIGCTYLHPQVSLERTSEGEDRLSQVCEEAERLQLHLSKAGATQVQEHLSSCQREWRNYLDSCSQSQRDLEESIDLLKKYVITLSHLVFMQNSLPSISWLEIYLASPLFSSFDYTVEGVRDWLKQMEISLKSEPALGADSQQGAPDTTEELERMENLHKELLARRYVHVVCEAIFQRCLIISCWTFWAIT